MLQQQPELDGARAHVEQVPAIRRDGNRVALVDLVRTRVVIWGACPP